MTQVVFIPELDPAMFDDAPCLGLSEIFFAHEKIPVDKAKALCQSCPHMVKCLEYAIDHREPAGVWGGQYIIHGRIVLNRNAGVGRRVEMVNDYPVPEHLQDHIRK